MYVPISTYTENKRKEISYKPPPKNLPRVHARLFPTTNTKTPPTINTPPAYGGQLTVFCLSADKCTGPASSTFSRCVYENPVQMSIANPATNNSTPIIFCITIYDENSMPHHFKAPLARPEYNNPPNPPAKATLSAPPSTDP